MSESVYTVIEIEDSSANTENMMMVDSHKEFAIESALTFSETLPDSLFVVNEQFLSEDSLVWLLGDQLYFSNGKQIANKEDHWKV